MEDKKASYYATIPASVRYDRDLRPNAKLLYGEITALCNARGFCWADNSYFANLYGTTTRSISSWIAQLNKKGYIAIDNIRNGSKEITQRHIYITDMPNLLQDTTGKNLHGDMKETSTGQEENFIGGGKNLHGGMEENFTDNNKDNNTMNTTMSIKYNTGASDEAKHTSVKFVKPTIEEIEDYCFEKKYDIDAERFFYYYESNGWMVGKNKMKSWKAALVNWEKNQKNQKDSDKGKRKKVVDNDWDNLLNSIGNDEYNWNNV